MTREILVLLSPLWWSVRNDLVRFHWGFYRKAALYTLTGLGCIVVLTLLFDAGMARLQTLSPDVFDILLVKGFSLIFIILFFVQVITGFMVTLSTFYQSPDLDGLFLSPVSRTALFFARLLQTQLRSSWMLLVFGLPLLIAVGRVLAAPAAYYPVVFALFAAFTAIPVTLGSGLAMVLASVFHINRMKRFAVSATLITLVVLIVILRVFRPERFVNPELFANLTLFVSELKTPAFILLPSRWLSETVSTLLHRDFIGTGLYAALLLLTLHLSVLLLYMTFKRYHFRGWLTLHAAGSAARRTGVVKVVAARAAFSAGRPARWLRSLLDDQSRQLIIKDILYQIRDIKGIQHSLIILSLIIVYLFSIASLPLNWEQYAVFLRYTVAFFNLGLILVILTALCSRISYPALTGECRTLWLIRTTPLTARRYVWTKFVYHLVPLFLAGQVLNVFSLLFIHIEVPVFVVVTLAVALASFSLVSMTVAFGIADMEESSEESEKSSTVHMVLSLLVVLFVLAIAIVPIYLFFLRESSRVTLTGRGVGIIVGTACMLVLFNILIMAVSLRFSIRRLARLGARSG